MNILIAINSAYIEPTKVMLYSLGSNNSDFLHIYLFYSKLTKKEIEKLKRFVMQYCHGELHPIALDGDLFEKFPIRGHFSRETYYRLYAPYLLPDSVERILWLDGDIIVKKSVQEFYGQDFKGNCLIACNNKSDINDDNVKRLGLKYGQYFNAGVLLMNLIEMRRKVEIREMEKMIDENLSLFEWQDQDILNLIYQEWTLLESEKFNCQVGEGREDNWEKVKQAAVLHYVGAQKPWQYHYKNRAGEYYFFYMKKVCKKKYLVLLFLSTLYKCVKRKQV